MVFGRNWTGIGLTVDMVSDWGLPVLAGWGRAVVITAWQ